MTAAAGSTRVVYLVWVIGGLLSLFGAMSYAEIAAMKPRVGGEYAFLRDAYGDPYRLSLHVDVDASRKTRHNRGHSDWPHASSRIVCPTIFFRIPGPASFALEPDHGLDRGLGHHSA